MASVAQAESRQPLAGILPWVSLAVVWIVWGSTFFAIRVAVQSIPPLLMAGTRYVIAGALLPAIVWLSKGSRRIEISPAQIRDALITGLLLLVAGNGLLSIAEVHLQSGTAALLVATVPLWMIAADAVLARKLAPSSAAGIIFGTLGVAALFGAPSAHESPISVAMVLASSLSWALGSVYAQRRSAGEAGAIAIGIEMFAAGVMMCAIASVRGEFAHVGPIPPHAIAAWVWLVLGGAMLGYSAYSFAVRTLPINVVATYAYVNPVVAVILGTVLLKEALTPNILLGGAAIVFSVVTIVLGNRPQIAPLEDVPEAA